MKRPLEPRLKSVQRPSEAVLREVEVDARLLTKGEAGSPQYFYLFGLPLLAMWIGWRQFWFLVGAGWDFSALMNMSGLAAAIGILLIVAIWLFLMKPRSPSPWLDMHRYVFTDSRILLLDAVGGTMDEISSDQIVDIIATQNGRGAVYSIDCLRLDDPDLECMFSIIHVVDIEAIGDFVRANYAGGAA